MIPLVTSTWTHEGKTYTQPSRPYKYALMVLAMEQHHLTTMIETGTFMGDTVGFFRHHMSMIYSIERNSNCYQRVSKRFEGCSNIILIEGDSGIELPRLVMNLSGPVLFWLDAHGDTEPHDYSGPILDELDAIFRSQCRGVILIDDADYLGVEFPEHPHWKMENLGGIVRYTYVVE